MHVEFGFLKRPFPLQLLFMFLSNASDHLLLDFFCFASQPFAGSPRQRTIAPIAAPREDHDYNIISLLCR